jgi:hypothetical protein
MKPRSLALIVGLWLLSGSAPIRAQTQQGEGGSGTQPPASPAQADPAVKPEEEATTPKPATKPHRVITNDDIEGKGAALYPSSTSVIDLNHINDCDRYCFEQVRQASHMPTGSNANWKRALLDAIEKVSADTAWQANLEQLARIKGKYCTLEADKNADLARHARPGTVTAGEISIEEAYERKVRALQAETVGVYERAEPLRAKYSGAVVQFMNIQQQRIVNATCPPVQRPAYRPTYNDPQEDPDDR